MKQPLFKRRAWVTFEHEGQTRTGQIVTARTKDGRARVEVLERMERRETPPSAPGRPPGTEYVASYRIYLIPQKDLRAGFATP